MKKNKDLFAAIAILAVVLAAMFREYIFYPSHIGFSNDGPIGVVVREWRAWGYDQDRASLSLFGRLVMWLPGLWLMLTLILFGGWCSKPRVRYAVGFTAIALGATVLAWAVAGMTGHLDQNGYWVG